jgi:1-pyrroline-5-carboxylate dehydrogenase
MANGIVSVPPPINDPINSYAPGSPEKVSLKAAIQSMLGEEIEIPLIIGGKEVRTGNTAKAVCPHDHNHVLGTYHKAGEAEVQMAINAAAKAWKEWSETPWEHRAAVMLKAAELLQGPWRDRLNAACMLNQSKSVFQAWTSGVSTPTTCALFTSNSPNQHPAIGTMSSIGRSRDSYLPSRHSTLPRSPATFQPRPL